MVVDAIRRNTLLLVTDEQVRKILVRRAQDPEAVLEEQIRTPHIIVAAEQAMPAREGAPHAVHGRTPAQKEMGP
jgi:hypothetical protein